MTADGRPPPHLALQVCRSADIIRTDRRMSNDDPLQPLADVGFGASDSRLIGLRGAIGRFTKRRPEK